ncbi:MAG: stage II sporulation protein R [Lachnospiraceae bacterium]|nr:stage II sporulation protein R [Lachnospiraceae bacterium]
MKNNQNSHQNRTTKNNGSIPTKNPLLALILAIIIGLTYTTLTSKPNVDLQTIQSGIAEKIVRFHVIANSDSKEDQELKLKVKDAVVAYTAPLLEHSSSIKESEQILQNESENIREIATSIIKENGYDYPVTTLLSNTYFPTKIYGNYTFPPGIYRAFEIKIGKAKGKNWWCVLYPPLCFIDISHGVIDGDSEKMLQETLSTDEFNAISKDSKVVYRFKYLTFLNRLAD